ncbi:MAG: sodium-translocating pyrophosphatase [Candidatus Paracaedibacteraceae bacterium]|nr:sodium-translocating pyrophosphatase [Candidatus Paracaedibacteraceae bacterium]
MDLLIPAILSCAVLALIYSIYVSRSVLRAEPGTSETQAIAMTIQKGAQIYLNRQYKTIGIVGIIIAFLIGYFLSPFIAVGFIIGALLSGLAGYIGMSVSVRANSRTAEAARRGLAPAMRIAFKAGAITGMSVVGLGLLGIIIYYAYLMNSTIDQRLLLESLIALGFGASLISIFARLGGGIFTKGADVGADLGGKIEVGIPEDDLRNPAVIADMIGDNVGDCAGMAADLFETYVVTIVASMVLAAIYFMGPLQHLLMLYPLMISAVCIIGSIVGTFFVRVAADHKVMKALYKGFLATLIISALLIYGTTEWLFKKIMDGGLTDTLPFTQLNITVCAFTGLSVPALLFLITEYYTSSSYRPVKSIAAASVSGHATNIIQGVAISMEATALPLIVISIGLIIAYLNASLFGVAITATTMLAIAGIVIALDVFGPVTDNAGGIAAMAKFPAEARHITEILDAVGNTTKAITKGYAIASASLASLILFTAFAEDLAYYFPHIKVDFSLMDPFVLIGLFLGGLLTYLFGAMGMKAVSRAGEAVVIEVRRQFKEIKGLLKGTQMPDYSKVVDLLTQTALREMIAPALLPLLSPLILYGLIHTAVGPTQAFTAVGAMLMGTTLTGLLLALSMTSGGAAWDNAKKYIEAGHYGGKGSEAYKAAVTGDTVGDPYKDTVGPAINPMIKITTIVAILLLAILARY